MAFDYEYPYTRNFGGDGLHDDPDTFDLGHEGESNPASGLTSLSERIAGDATFDGNAFRIHYTGAFCNVQFTSALSGPDEAALDAHVAAQRVQADWNVLADLKYKKMQEFDVRTAELIEEGYENGIVYDLRLPHQMFLSGLRIRLNKARLADEIWGESTEEADFTTAHFPLYVNSLDNMTEITLFDGGDFEEYYDMLSDAVEAIEAGGNTLKNSVRAAANKAAVDAVVDGR